MTHPDLSVEGLAEVRAELVDFLTSCTQFWKRCKVEQLFAMIQRRDAAIECLRVGLKDNENHWHAPEHDTFVGTQKRCTACAALTRAEAILKGPT